MSRSSCTAAPACLDEDYRKAIDAGIRKINYYTYGVKYAGEAVSPRPRAPRRQTLPPSCTGTI